MLELAILYSLLLTAISVYHLHSSSSYHLNLWGALNLRQLPFNTYVFINANAIPGYWYFLRHIHREYKDRVLVIFSGRVLLLKYYKAVLEPWGCWQLTKSLNIRFSGYVCLLFVKGNFGHGYLQQTLLPSFHFTKP